MSTLNIESLLRDLEEEHGLTKSASEDISTDEKPSLSEELESLLTKKASVEAAGKAGGSLAKSILTKMANEIITENAVAIADHDAAITPTAESGDETVEEMTDSTLDKAIENGAQPMDKAQVKAAQINDKEKEMTVTDELIEKIAQAVIEELAGEEGTVPTKIEEDNALMVAQHDAAVQETPGGEGTVNQILDAIVADAKASGAVSENTAASGESQAAAEAARMGDEVEKAAAVSALVEAGVDFDEATDLVKQAALEIEEEELEQEKQAALEEAVEAGVDFDTAVELVKEASTLGAVKGVLTKLKAGVGKEVGNLKASATGLNGAAKGVLTKLKAGVGKEVGNLKASTTGLKGAATMKGLSAKARANLAGQSLKEMAKNRVVQGGAAAAAVGGAAMAMNREKKAAYDALVEAGVDFDTAVELVKEASEKVYGKQ